MIDRIKFFAITFTVSSRKVYIQTQIRVVLPLAMPPYCHPQGCGFKAQQATCDVNLIDTDVLALHFCCPQQPLGRIRNPQDYCTF